MSKLIFESFADVDEQGDLEIMTFDLNPIVSSKLTLHLDDRGLPKIGTSIVPGTIIIGKIGKSSSYDSSRRPSSLELHGWEFEKLKSVYGDMWLDRSVYATTNQSGIVVSSELTEKDGRQCAVVVIDTQKEDKGTFRMPLT